MSARASRETCPPKMNCPACNAPALAANMHRCHECGSTDCEAGDWTACSQGHACDDPRCDSWLWRDETEVSCPGCKRLLMIVVEDEAAELVDVEADRALGVDGRGL